MTLTEYSDIIRDFKLQKYLEQDIHIRNINSNAWIYYKERLDVFWDSIINLMKMGDTTPPLVTVCNRLECIFYEGALKDFKPLIEYIKEHAPMTYGSINQEMIDKVTLTFNRFLANKYLTEVVGLNGYLGEFE